MTAVSHTLLAPPGGPDLRGGRGSERVMGAAVALGLERGTWERLAMGGEGILCRPCLFWMDNP